MKGKIMDFREIIPITVLRKFDAMCLKDEKLHQNKELQQQILSWAAELLEEARDNWGKLHATTMDAVVAEDRRAQTKKRGRARDNKYAPFREYFRKVQKERFDEALKNGGKLTANGFAHWFLENRESDMEIPYEEGNKLHKLIRLAEANNREFKTPIESKNG